MRLQFACIADHADVSQQGKLNISGIFDRIGGIVMTDREIQDLLATYSLHVTSTRRADSTPVFLAWYDELPGCMVEAASRPDVLLELDAIAPVIIQTLIAENVSLPVPVSTRTPRAMTNRYELNGLLVGGPVSTLPTATARLAQPPKVTQGTLVCTRLSPTAWK